MCSLLRFRDDTVKTKAQKLKVVGGDDRKFLFPESSSGRKLSSLKLALSRFGDVAWIWQTTLADPRYISRLDVDWGQVSSTLEDIDCAREGNLRIGLLNFNLSEVRSWQQTLPPHAELSSVHLDHADTNLTWELLYPEWIDEEEESGV
ncbi:hypothetical protein C4D60_Mb07t04080 [Musa balbisiana]|uniref:Uncharacterized protein n=1 Tax=Musa balbisiana TaxID=52838 RepID=A0A4S8JCV3_MUSBA|nr:hypothetical protein C4D60_Mb07t04080 [Musa balbisiana]